MKITLFGKKVKEKPKGLFVSNGKKYYRFDSHRRAVAFPWRAQARCPVMRPEVSVQNVVNGARYSCQVAVVLVLTFPFEKLKRLSCRLVPDGVGYFAHEQDNP